MGLQITIAIIITITIENQTLPNYQSRMYKNKNLNEHQVFKWLDPN